jgi:hypothetical protein
MLRDELVQEELRDRRPVDRTLFLHARVREERAELGPERDPRLASRAERGVVERLLAEAVPREKERALRRVPVRKREHPLDARESARSPCIERRQQHLGVARRLHMPARGREVLPQRAPVVDLPVERQDRPARPEHRLTGRVREIDDRQAPVPQPEPRLEVAPLCVRAAVQERRRHAIDDTAIHRSSVTQRNADDPAHARVSSAARRVRRLALWPSPRAPRRSGRRSSRSPARGRSSCSGIHNRSA